MAIKDVEFDYSLGKLGESDRDELLGAYRQKAIKARNNLFIREG